MSICQNLRCWISLSRWSWDAKIPCYNNNSDRSPQKWYFSLIQRISRPSQLLIWCDSSWSAKKRNFKKRRGIGILKSLLVRRPHSDRRTKGVDVCYFITFIEHIEDASESFPNIPPDPYNPNSITWLWNPLKVLGLQEPNKVCMKVFVPPIWFILSCLVAKLPLRGRWLGWLWAGWCSEEHPPGKRSSAKMQQIIWTC